MKLRQAKKVIKNEKTGTHYREATLACAERVIAKLKH